MILQRLAILISVRSGGYYFRKAQRRDRLLSAMLAGAVGFLNLTRAVGKLQRWQAPILVGNDHARLLIAGEISRLSTTIENFEKLFNLSRTLACVTQLFHFNSSFRQATELSGTDSCRKQSCASTLFARALRDSYLRSYDRKNVLHECYTRLRGRFSQLNSNYR